MIHYRRLWEKANGPLPVDDQGRSFHIHHIDGDRSNNDLSNLKAVSLQEHYDIHLSQGDYGACMRLAVLLKKDGETLSRLAKESGKINQTLEWRQKHSERMSGANHPFYGKKRPEHAKKISQLFKGKPKSEEHKAAIKANWHREKVTCEHCGLSTTKAMHTRWHGSNCRKAS